jgi:gliding motility-associated-like protein
MQKRILLLLQLLLPLFALAQMPKIYTKAGSGLNDEPLDVLRISTGKIYTTGYYSQLAFFGSQTVSFTGIDDAYIACQSTNGNYDWVLSVSGASSDRGIALAQDNANNIYATGYYRGSVTLGTTTINSVGGSQDVFLAKISSTGNVIWFKSFGGTGIETVSSIAVKDNFGIALIGQFNGTTTWESTNLTSTEFLSSGNPGTDIFVAKLDIDGNFQAVTQIASPDNDIAAEIAFSDVGKKYFAVNGTGTLQIGAQNINMGNSGYGALICLDTDESFEFVKKFQAPFIELRSLDIRGNDLAVGGNFNNTMSTDIPGFTGISGGYTYNIFGVRLNLDGGYVSHFNESSVSEISLNDLCFNQSQKLWAAGSFDCTFSSLSDDLGDGLFNNVGNNDGFVALYAMGNSNNRRYAQQVGSAEDDNLNAISARHSEYPVLAGSFEDWFYLPVPTGSFNSGPASILNPMEQLNICNSSIYNEYLMDFPIGSRDIFVTTILDTLAPVFDIYERTECNTTIIEPEFNYPSDTLVICNPTSISNFELHTLLDIALYTSTVSPSSMATSTGWYVATFETPNDCRTFTDSLYVLLGGSTYDPEITAPGTGLIYPVYNPPNDCPQNLQLPTSGSLLATGNTINAGDNSTWTDANGVTLASNTSNLTITEAGIYTYTITNAQGCEYSTCINIFDYALTENGVGVSTPEDVNLDPTFDITAQGLVNDTLFTCSNNPIVLTFQPFSAPGVQMNYPIPAYANWEITGPFVVYPLNIGGSATPTYSFMEHEMIFRVTQTGPVHIRIEFYAPPGNTDVLTVVEYDIYVIQNVSNQPQLIVNWITSTEGLCPGDTITIGWEVFPANFPFTSAILFGTPVASTPDSYSFNAPASIGIAMNYTDSITGCSVNAQRIKQITYKEAPGILTNPDDGRKCPEDSVQLIADPGLSISWIGPGGETIPDEFEVDVVTPGNYYYNLIDLDGCALLSQTVEIRNIQAVIYDSIITSNICGGQDALIRLAPDTNLIYTWLAPLSGSDTLKYIDQPGTYSVRVELCSNIDTLTFTVREGLDSALLSIVGQPTILCEGGSVQLTANTAADTIIWSPGNITGPFYTVTQASNVVVTLSDTIGCVLRDSMQFNLNPNPPTPDTLFPGQVCPDIPLVLSTDVNFPFVWHEMPDTILLGTAPTLPYNLATDGQIIGGYAINPTTGCRSDWFEQALDLLTVVNIPPIIDQIVFCPGDTINIQPNAVSQIVSAIWSGPNQFQSNNSNLFLPDILSSSAGSYFYVPIFAEGFCSSERDTVDLILRTLEEPQFSFTDSICAGEALTFQVQQQSDYTYAWVGPGGISENDITFTIPSAQANNSGTYLLTSRDSNCVRTDTFALFVSAVPPNNPQLIYPETICEGDTLFLFNGDSAAVPGLEVTWFGSNNFVPDGPHSVYIPNFNDSLNATFGIQLNVNYCFSDSSTAEIEVLEVPSFSFGGDPRFCFGESYTISGPDNVTNYLWHTGSTAQTITITETDTVSLVVTYANGCFYWNSIIVEEVNCNLNDTPNAFSPNGDGVNDNLEFKVGGGEIYSILIYNRWGRLLKEIGPDVSFWDGTDLNGNLVPDGTYFYIISVEMINQTTDKVQGFVSVFK